MKIVPFEPRHLTEIAPGPFETLALHGTELGAFGAICPVPGPALTLLGEDGAPLGAAGIVPLWRGVAQAWVFASDHLRARPVAMHRTIARALDAAEAHLRLHRVQLDVHENFQTSLRWVERLGFRFEGIMPGYGPNRDTYLRYARIKPCPPPP